MIRRSFRIGLTLGLLGGLAFALVRMFGPRPDPVASHPPVPTEPWPRLQVDPVQPAPGTVALVPDPAAPAPAVAAPAAAAPPVAAPAVKAAAPKAAVKRAPVATRAPAAKKTPVAKQPAVGKQVAAKKVPAKKKPLVALWVEPKGDVCPTSHPVKAKLTSKIFHLPGMLNYQRSKPDRCYRDATAAEADGLRPAKK